MIFDSHAHYDHDRYTDDRDAFLTALPERGVSYVLNTGSDVESSHDSIKLAEKYPFIYASVGVHPHYAHELTEADIDELTALCKHEKVVAFGEIGLDFHHDHAPRDMQRYWFKRQLEAAQAVDLPVIIHSREACDEVFETITKSNARRGVIHSFSGSADTAKAYVDLGFYIGIGGIITFDKTRRLHEVAAAIPLERILVETDAPYLTPAPHRGKRNDSAFLEYVIREIAEAKGLVYEAVAAQTRSNAKELFGIATHSQALAAPKPQPQKPKPPSPQPQTPSAPHSDK